MHEPERREGQRDRVRDREPRHDEQHRAQRVGRDQQPEEKQQVIRSAQNVNEAKANKAERGLVPSRIEVDEPRIAGEFERAHGAARRQKTDGRDDAKPEARKGGTDRES